MMHYTKFDRYSNLMKKSPKRPLQEDTTNIEKKIKTHNLDKITVKIIYTEFKEIVRWTPETKEELKEKILLYYGKDIDEEKKKQFQHISLWNTKKITNFDNLFEDVDPITFNEDISNWNTSNVKSMNGTFEGLELFDQDISTKFIQNKENSYYAWDVSNVTDMGNILANCSSFNQDISNWDVTNVTDMSSLFYNCVKFNQEISTKPTYLNNEFKWIAWDTKNCTTMDNMFSNDDEYFYNSNSEFNGNISNWNISKCESLRMMFKYSNFKQDISTKNITIKYKSNLSSNDFQIYTYTAWDTSNVEDISHMFSCHKNFDNSYLKIGNWNLSKLINISCTFENIDFNFDITHWAKYLEENIKQFFSLFNKTRFKCKDQYEDIKLFFQENEDLPFWRILIKDYEGEDEWELNDEHLKYLKSLTGEETDSTRQNRYNGILYF